MKKYVYSFGNGRADGDATRRLLLGGKGANLAEMAKMGIPVPAGFTISTDVCTWFYENKRRYPGNLTDQVDRAMARMERALGRNFGDESNPLLVSVRSGAAFSMPGMMDTVLNLGLNDKTVVGLAETSGNPRFAWDSYRRFIQMYGNVVLEMKPESKLENDPFEEMIEKVKEECGVQKDTDLDVDALRKLVRLFKAAIKRRTGKSFPTDPMKQLWGAIGAVFGSWMNDRAIAYRKLNDIPQHLGTAVNVQAMVYGNTGKDSGTGVAFTRDASTGENKFYGEYLVDAQGEDVVAGTRTPQKIDRLQKDMPKVYSQLKRIYKKLEKHYRDMQDIEFTIEHGRLWMLQTRAGKRTGFAAIRIAADMAREGLISREEAILRVEPFALEQVLRPVFDTTEKKKALESGRHLATGLNAGPGAATGRVVFHADDAVREAAKGQDVILVRYETSPEDISGMAASLGILTARGGMTSHAAVVARQMGKTCVAGTRTLSIDYKRKRFTVAGRTIRDGDEISLDGSTGEVIEGRIKTIPSEITRALNSRASKARKSRLFQAYKNLMSWADKARTMKIRTNADQPDQARMAIAFGAEGIGLCRTEHMFFGQKKLHHMRHMILAETKEERLQALKKLLPIQRRDFERIFTAMNGRPVTIRTLDPPLHEFLPTERAEIEELALEMGLTVRDIKRKVNELHEINPMLGHRGCRLGISYPEITEMQARAIFEGACNVKKKGGRVRPEIMIPLVGDVHELDLQTKIVRDVAKLVFARKGIRVPYLVGTMIEIPRAAITADQIAECAEFFSFGTNDLTQTTFGFSRDDAAKFLQDYYDLGIFETDPFGSLDIEGVGLLMKIAVEKGHQVRPNLKLGICGEHGGDPDSIRFCQTLGLDYVSCSPYRVPIARLVAAQAAIEERAAGKSRANRGRRGSKSPKSRKSQTTGA